MNFNEDINRYNTNSLKFDFKEERNKPNDVFPMWVADMDFKCCDEILNDLRKKIDHGIFGYSKNDKEYFIAVSNWYKNNFDISLEEDWLITTPGVVFALATAVKVLTDINDYVLINNPVYYPFSEVIIDNKENKTNEEVNEEAMDLMLKYDIITTESAEKLIAKNKVNYPKKMQKMLDLFEDNDDIQNVWHNWEMPDEE